MSVKSKSDKNIFKKQECQDIYNKLCSLFLNKKEAKNIAIKCVKNNQKCDFGKYEKTIDERTQSLKIQDLKLREYYNIDAKYVYLNKLNKIEEILFIRGRCSDFEKKKNYELILKGNVEPITINERYIFRDITKAKDFKSKRDNFLSCNWFDLMFSEVDSINKLPKIGDIFDKIESETKGILDRDELLDIFLDIKSKWNDYEISIVNGREIRKVIFKSDKKCFNHTAEDSYLYQTSPTTYICATCLEWLVSDPYDIEDNVLFPLDLDKTQILNWLKDNRPILVKKYMEDLLIIKYMKIRIDDSTDISELSPKLKNLKKQEIIDNLLLLGYPNYIATSNAQNYIESNLCPTYEELEILRNKYIANAKKQQQRYENMAGKNFRYVLIQNDIFEIDYVLNYKKIATVKIKDNNEYVMVKTETIFGTYEEALIYKEELEENKANRLKEIQEKLAKERMLLELIEQEKKQVITEKYKNALLNIGYTNLEANEIIKNHNIEKKEYSPIKEMVDIFHQKVNSFSEENEFKTKYKKRFKYVVTIDGIFKIRYLISNSNNLFTFNVIDNADALTVGVDNIFAHFKTANNHFEHLNTLKIECDAMKKLIEEDPFSLKKELEAKYNKAFKYAVTREEMFSIKNVISVNNNLITLSVYGSTNKITVHVNNIYAKHKTAKRNFENFDKIHKHMPKELISYKEKTYELEKKLNKKLNYVLYENAVYTMEYLITKEINEIETELYTVKVLELEYPITITLDRIFTKKKTANKYILNLKNPDIK